MIKVKTIGQMLPFKKRHGFAQSISSAWLGILGCRLPNTQHNALLRNWSNCASAVIHHVLLIVAEIDRQQNHPTQKGTEIFPLRNHYLDSLLVQIDHLLT